MNNKTHFTVLLPLGREAQDMLQQESSRKDLRAMLWSQAAECMKPLLGRTCARFSPAVLPDPLPYGVAFGQTEPQTFLMCYLTAREAQEEELAARNLWIHSRGQTILSERLGENIGVTITAFQRGDPELNREFELGDRFLQNDITGAACLYYLGIKKNYIGEALENQILSQIGQYAICVADLWPMEG